VGEAAGSFVRYRRITLKTYVLKEVNGYMVSLSVFAPR
jgi:hypothetical protein